jgi:LCP family protein required for cell wall assembly
MSDMTSRNTPDDGISIGAGPGAGPEQEEPPRRRRRGLRIALVSVASLVVFLGAVVAGGYAYVNHLAGSVPRIPVRFMKLDAASQPLAGNGRGGMTVLITGKGIGPTGATSVPEDSSSGLIMLLHINANHQAGGVVSIPPQTIVRIPGHGRTKIQDALTFGGPSLLVQTVENLTHDQIDHYARIDFAHVANVVNVIGGVNVTLPETTTSFGHVFHIGVNHLNGVTALYYARQPSLTEEGRVLRQQSLIRAILQKLGNRHMLTNPITMYRVLHALIGMLTVDSDFSNSELEHLAAELGRLNGHSGTFVTAPTRVVAGQVYLDRAIAQKLWAAIRQDSISAFAMRYPFTVTPSAPQ